MLKDKLKSGSTVLGTWCEIPSPMTANVLAKAGLDFIIVDMEHGPMDYRVAQEMAMAAEADGCEAIIRVPDAGEPSILRALDTGARGIVVPHVEAVEDVKAISESAMFAPEGRRGYNPYIRSGGYHGGDSTYFAAQNERTLVAVIVEGTTGIENLEAIASHPVVDVVYVGVYDLSVALGVPGEVKSTRVLRALADATRRINACGKAAGGMVHVPEDLRELRAIGVRFIAYKTDTAILYDSFLKMRKELPR